MTVEKTVHKIDIYAFEYSFMVSKTNIFLKATRRYMPNAENNYQSVYILMVIPI